MKALITGGCGFVGSNMAARLLSQGAEVELLDDLSRAGSAENLKWLETQGTMKFHRVDVRDAAAVAAVIARYQPDAVFHLAGQVAMTVSMKDPRRDFETNALGTFNVLEALRLHSPKSAIVYASTNKVYGALETVPLTEGDTRYLAPKHPHGVDESAPLDFQTPYGCSKGAAEQYVLDWVRGYGLDGVVFRHSTIYGGRQFATFDQGWVGWFCSQAVRQERDPASAPFTIAGDGKQVRDLLYVDDAVDAYLAAVARVKSVRGRVFNLGGGFDNSSSLLELFRDLEGMTGTPLRFERTPWRHSDQRYFVADVRRAEAELGWRPKVSKAEGLKRSLAWAREAKG